MESTSIRIIADDLGLSTSINKGIFELLQNGKVQGASLMASGQAFDDAVFTAASYGGGIGIHFVLVEEPSLTGMQLPKNHKVFFLKYILGLISKKEIEAEMRAQLEKLLKTRVRPTQINSHQHLHLLPGIMDIVIKIAKENSINYVRLVNEPIHGMGKLFRKAQLIFLNFLSSLAKKKLDQNNIGYNSFFIGFINAGNLGNEDLLKARELALKHPDKIIELGCHPGYQDEALVQKYKHWDYHWESEINILKQN